MKVVSQVGEAQPLVLQFSVGSRAGARSLLCRSVRRYRVVWPNPLYRSRFLSVRLFPFTVSRAAPLEHPTEIIEIIFSLPLPISGLCPRHYRASSAAISTSRRKSFPRGLHSPTLHGLKLASLHRQPGSLICPTPARGPRGMILSWWPSPCSLMCTMQRFCKILLVILIIQ